ncbi:MAG: DapH/DapD/GlmU-related protein [Pseudodesulfovibrio sp.]
MLTIREIRDELAYVFEAILMWWPGRTGRALRRWLLRKKLMYVGEGVRIGEGCQLSGDVELGENVSIGRGGVLVANQGLPFGRIRLGDHAATNHGVFISAGNGGDITVGSYTIFGPGVILRSGDHCFDDPDTPIRHQGHTHGDIIIGDDVWLGARVFVGKGVTIGRGAVVGAGAVVVKDIPEYGVAVGVPAKVIRYRGRK